VLGALAALAASTPAAAQLPTPPPANAPVWGTGVAPPPGEPEPDADPEADPERKRPNGDLVEPWTERRGAARPDPWSDSRAASPLYEPRRLGPPPPYLEPMPNAPPPHGYELGTRARRGMILAGAITFGTLYTVSIILAAAAGSERGGGSLDPLYVPVVGPFLAAGTVQTTSLGTFALVADGVAQNVGVALFIMGFAAPETVWARKGASLELVPLAAPGTLGALVRGRL
jgi:hypothetical protein